MVGMITFYWRQKTKRAAQFSIRGAPLIAAGVQSELEHAAASTKEVLVVWEAERDPTPFIGQKVDRSFKSIEELDGYLKSISQRPGQLEMPME